MNYMQSRHDEQLKVSIPSSSGHVLALLQLLRLLRLLRLLVSIPSSSGHVLAHRHILFNIPGVS